MANLHSPLPPPTNLPFFSFIFFFLPLICCLSLFPQSPLQLHRSPCASGSFTVAWEENVECRFLTLDCAVYKLHVFIFSLPFLLHSWQLTRHADCHDNSWSHWDGILFYTEPKPLQRAQSVLCFTYINAGGNWSSMTVHSYEMAIAIFSHVFFHKDTQVRLFCH